jgi:hypothetical protein
MLLLGLLILTPALPLSGQEKKDTSPSISKSTALPEAGTVEVRFIDGSTMRLVLRDQKIDLTSPYGKMQVPVHEIHKIEFATRVPDDVSRRIEAAVANLGDDKFPVREKASAELLKLSERAYPALQRAAGSKDLEVARRAQDLLDKIRDLVPEDALEVREHDVIHTAHSKLAGRIDAPVLKVETAQFGELQMKLTDVRSLRSLGVPEESETNLAGVEADPVTLTSYMAQIGKTFRFRVTGGTPGAGGMVMGGGRRMAAGGGGAMPAGAIVFGGMMAGGLWGTDTYTADSSLALAAVHAGVLKNGQTGIVKVKIVNPPASFEASTRNGVSSGAYGSYPGAFKVMR